MLKKKLLILQNELSAYNVPVYNIIAEYYELTVGFYLKDKSKQDCLFEKKQFDIKRFKSLVFVRGLLAFAKGFDIISIIPDMHVATYCILPFLKRNYKVTSWSIGFRVSYKHPFDTERRHILADQLFKSILSHCDASIFYMEKAKEFWRGTNLDMNKVFVAPNTTNVLPITINKEIKKSFLFVGTLYKGKGLDILLKSYQEAVLSGGISNQLHIVGDGAERQNLEQFVSDNKLEEKVIFHGAIYDENELAELFTMALLCISPNQGGLSVPKSMGYGVPFVTRKDAITGGEIYHIKPDVNGIMYENDEDLTNILIDASKNQQKYVEMGLKAKDYYDNHASIIHMAQGAMDAFEYALKH